MIPETAERLDKKASFSRRRASEPVEFDSEITLRFDEFFRFFNYYYPGKNKEDIIRNSPLTQTSASLATPTGSLSMRSTTPTLLISKLRG